MNIYKIQNLLINKVIIIQDMIFNENQFFNSNIKQLRDNLLQIITKEIEVLLYSIEIQTEPLESGNINYFEDNKLYITIREVIPDK